MEKLEDMAENNRKQNILQEIKYINYIIELCSDILYEI